MTYFLHENGGTKRYNFKGLGFFGKHHYNIMSCVYLTMLKIYQSIYRHSICLPNNKITCISRGFLEVLILLDPTLRNTPENEKIAIKEI